MPLMKLYQEIGTKENPIHFTSLESWVYCGMKFFLEHTVGLPYVSWYALRGTIIHKTFVEGIGKLKDIFFDEVHKQTKPIQTTPNTVIKEEALNKEYDDMMVTLPYFWRYLEMFCIEVQETEVTFLGRPFSLVKYAQENCPDLCDLWFQGTVDAITVHPDTPKGMIEIPDWKSGRKWGQETLNRKLQFGGYYLLTRLHHKVNRIFWGQVKHLAPAKSNTKAGVRKGEFKAPFLYAVKITDKDLPFICEQTDTIVRAIDEGIYPWAANGADAPCSLCPFTDGTCPSYKIGNRQDDHADSMMNAMMLKKMEDLK